MLPVTARPSRPGEQSLKFVVFEVGDGRAPTAGLRRRVRPVANERRAGEDAMDKATLHPLPLAVDDPHAPKSGAVRFGQIFMHDAFNVARRDGVEVENVGDLKPDDFGKEVILVGLVKVCGFRDGQGRRGTSVMGGRVRCGAQRQPLAAEPLQ